MNNQRDAIAKVGPVHPFAKMMAGLIGAAPLDADPRNRQDGVTNLDGEGDVSPNPSGNIDAVPMVQALLPILSSFFPMLMTGNVLDDLQKLRAALPFLPIIPFPNASRAAVMAAVPVALDIPFPDNALLFRLQSDATFYASTVGMARVPLVTDTPDNPASFMFPFGAPYDQWFYAGNRKSISVIGGANQVITANFLVQV
jgi:hypothetical protein